MDISIAFLVGFILFYIAYRITKRPHRFPPGPRLNLPVLGHVLSLGKNHLKAHVELRKKYGDIVGLQIGNLSTVCIYDPKLLKEAFNNPNFSGRPDLPIFNEASGGKYGIIAGDGESWSEQRRFSIRHLRDLGFAKSYMESLIQEEVVELIDGLSKETGKPLDMRHRFGIVTLNSIWRLVTGERVSHDDPKLTGLLKSLHSAFHETVGGSISLFIPFLTKLFPKYTGYEKFITASKAPFPFYEAQIEAHRKTFEDGDARDFMDDYLQEMKKANKDPKSSFHGANGEKHFKAVVHDLFLGGSETSSLTLLWLILYLATNPKVQEKLFDEIDKVVGKSNLPTLNDRVNMPYAEAVINETLRCSSIVPFGVMHSAMEDTEFNGYLIPKNTGVSAFPYGIHHDPKIWGDPENFRPERFLNEDGKFQKNDLVVAFSHGKRKCPGETLALDQLFLITTSLYQRFIVKPNPEEPLPSVEPDLMMFLVPKTYKVVLEDRNASK